MRNKLLGLFLASTIFATSLSTSYADNSHKTQTTQTQQALSVNDFNKKPGKKIIWGVKLSPYVFIDLVMLNAIGINYEARETLPTLLLNATNQEVPEDFTKASVLGKVPAYEESGTSEKPFYLSDSLAIAGYFEKAIDNNPLYPKCPKAYGRVSFFTLYAYNDLAPLTHQILFQEIVKPQVLKQDKDEKVINDSMQSLEKVFNFLEKSLADGRNWIADTKNMSMADIAIVGHMVSLIRANKDLNATIGSNRPHLQKYVQKVLATDAFKKALNA